MNRKTAKQFSYANSRTKAGEIAARVETAKPFPLRLGAWITDDARDGVDMNVAIVDEPAIGAV